jgi:hypothetical protein
VVYADMLPRLRLERGRLFVEPPSALDRFVPVGAVVFHGIYENDLPFLTTLALWGGPCLPGAQGMMDCRQRVPGLVRALRVTRFGGLPRGFADRGTLVTADGATVAKWGEWHCGENKARFTGEYRASVPTLFEPFVDGSAVRIHVTGDRVWQIRLAGDGWLKSIHHPEAGFLPVDPELRDDALGLQRHFGLEMLGIDYMVAETGARYLLEVNHIPNVTVFPELREAFLEFAERWTREQFGRAER